MQINWTGGFLYKLSSRWGSGFYCHLLDGLAEGEWTKWSHTSSWERLSSSCWTPVWSSFLHQWVQSQTPAETVTVTIVEETTRQRVKQIWSDSQEVELPGDSLGCAEELLTWGWRSRSSGCGSGSGPGAQLTGKLNKATDIKMGPRARNHISAAIERRHYREKKKHDLEIAATVWVGVTPEPPSSCVSQRCFWSLRPPAVWGRQMKPCIKTKISTGFNVIHPLHFGKQNRAG